MEREYDPAAHEDQTPWKKKKKNKRRFSDEQIRSLESIFESETRLEPRKKLQVARELGLQPRQVGIWFQNRRARWKSKQMEKDFRTLRANYDSLASRFESLKNEKQGLILQMQKLSELLAEPHDISKGSKGGVDGSSIGAGGGGGSEQADNKCEPEAEVQPSFQQAGLGDGRFHGSQIEKDEDNIIGHAGQQAAGEEEFLSMDHEYRSEFPASSPEKLYGFDSADMFDHSCSNSQWLDFWT